MKTLATDVFPTLLKSPAPERKKRQRGNRKANTVNIVADKPKKKLLLEELGNTLVDQLYATTQNDGRLEPFKISAVDCLRSDFTTDLISSSCASSRSDSSRALTGVESTPPTSLDDRSSNEISATPSSSTGARHPHPSTDSLRTPPVNNQKGGVFRLDDFSTMAAIQRLAAQYGQVAHMGILDRSYQFFVNTGQTAALSFKVQNKVAIVGGDPLCEADTILDLLAEFAAYRRQHRWGIAFMGASEAFVRDFAQPRGWTTIRFGTERVLNPQTNEVLLERGSKRIAVQSRQLLHPHKCGVTLGIYAPAAHGTDAQLQAELIAIYDAWRVERNRSVGPQAFITVLDPFALPSLMLFVYTRGPNGQVNGFAALRHLASGGYHVDPCIAALGSPKGISDLMIVAAMSLLHRVGVSYLGFGFEASHALSPDDFTAMPGPVAYLARDLYEHTFRRLPIRGKKAYHDKFRPDASQDSGVYLIFPQGVPGPRHLLGMLHVSNISLRKILFADLRTRISSRDTESLAAPPPAPSDAVGNKPVTREG